MASSQYKNRAKALKKLGVIDYDLRKELTPGQKSYITKKYNEFSHYIQAPDDFAVRNISHKLGQAFKESGYQTIKRGKKTRLILPVPPNSEVHIKKGIAYIDSPSRIEQIFPAPKKKFFDVLENVTKLNLQKDQFITAKIGHNRPFNRLFNDPKTLLNYVQNAKFKSEDAIRHLSIVQMKLKRDENGKIIKRQKPKTKKKNRRH